MATRHILVDLARDYEQRNGVAVDIRSMGGVEAAKLVGAGEPVDLVVLAKKVMQRLEAEGWVAPGKSRTSRDRRSRSRSESPRRGLRSGAKRPSGRPCRQRRPPCGLAATPPCGHFAAAASAASRAACFSCSSAPTLAKPRR